MPFTGFSLRESVSGEKTLPSARAVANVLRKHLKKPPVTGVFGEWGHFIQRDSFSIPVRRSGMGIAPAWAFRNILLSCLYFVFEYERVII